jgi:NitT/TauT family transport system ATP-binding protein
LRRIGIEARHVAFLSIEHASFAFETAKPVVDEVDWSIEEGGFHCLIGRSGCGKTSLLKLAAGLLLPNTGSIRVQGDIVQGPSRAVGFVFQSPTLLGWRTVLDNVMLPVSLQQRVGGEDIARARHLLELVGLQQLSARFPRELSGGQQSRVAIARALISQPVALLMDEPFAALDAITREELQDDLLKLCAAARTTVLFVTHDIAEAVYLGDRIAVMHQGRLVHDLAVDIPRPRMPDIRFSHEFNRLCRGLHDCMKSAT